MRQVSALRETVNRDSLLANGLPADRAHRGSPRGDARADRRGGARPGRRRRLRARPAVQAVAARAGVAVGTVYRHFPSKGDLFAEVFRRASQRELDVVVEVSDADGRSARERVAAAVEAFCRRALAGPVLAYALLAEPVDPAVEAERLRFRIGYRDAFARVLADGVARRRAAPARHPHGRRRAGRRARRGARRPAVHRRRPRPPRAGSSRASSSSAWRPLSNSVRRHCPVLTSASTHDVLNQAAAARALQRLRRRPRAARGARARGRRLGRRPPARHRRAWPARPEAIEHAGAPSATSRSCAPTTATATASTRSSSTRRGTGCCARRSSARSTRCRGATRSRARTSCARGLFCSGARSTPASCARSR